MSKGESPAEAGARRKIHTPPLLYQQLYHKGFRASLAKPPLASVTGGTRHNAPASHTTVSPRTKLCTDRAEAMLLSAPKVLPDP